MNSDIHKERLIKHIKFSPTGDHVLHIVRFIFVEMLQKEWTYDVFIPRLTSGSILSKNWDSMLNGDRKSANSWLLLSSGCCRSVCSHTHTCTHTRSFSWVIFGLCCQHECKSKNRNIFNVNKITKCLFPPIMTVNISKIVFFPLKH